MKKHQTIRTEHEHRRTRKLELHRETLRRLDAGALATVAGGMPGGDITDCGGFTCTDTLR